LLQQNNFVVINEHGGTTRVNSRVHTFILMFYWFFICVNFAVFVGELVAVFPVDNGIKLQII